MCARLRAMPAARGTAPKAPRPGTSGGGASTQLNIAVLLEAPASLIARTGTPTPVPGSSVRAISPSFQVSKAAGGLVQPDAACSRPEARPRKREHRAAGMGVMSNP